MREPANLAESIAGHVGKPTKKELYPSAVQQNIAFPDREERDHRALLGHTPEGRAVWDSHADSALSSVNRLCSFA